MLHSSQLRFHLNFFRADKQVASGECMQKRIRILFWKSHLLCPILIKTEYSTIFCRIIW